MSLNSINTGQGSVEQKASQEIVIDFLLSEFHKSLDMVASEEGKRNQLIEVLEEYNPIYEPIEVETTSERAKVLAQVVAGVYAPLIHGFTQTVLNNIKIGVVSENIIAPPRDAIPLAMSLKAMSDQLGIGINLMSPHINRNIAGIANNQKNQAVLRDPLIDIYFDQEKAKMNGREALTEVETGIYGTTSLVTAEAFKLRGVQRYVPIKFYGLGPNLSYIHAVLSQGQEWVAGVAEEKALVNKSLIESLMVILDTMEELGMEKFYKSVEKLTTDSEGVVVPVIVPVSDEQLEIARVTNSVLVTTAESYLGILPEEILEMLGREGWLREQSKSGLPITLKAAIPSMDSKEEHFKNIRASKLFDYPNLII